MYFVSQKSFELFSKTIDIKKNLSNIVHFHFIFRQSFNFYPLLILFVFVQRDPSGRPEVFWAGGLGTLAHHHISYSRYYMYVKGKN